MLILVLRTAILMAAMLSGCLQAGTLDDIRALEAGKNGHSAPALDGLRLPESNTPPSPGLSEKTSPLVSAE